MQREYSVVCDEGLAREIDALASEYDASHEEVIRQLLDVGLDEIDR
jgi:hypothetical protein